jgi:hypothetical protein
VFYSAFFQWNYVAVNFTFTCICGSVSSDVSAIVFLASMSGLRAIFLNLVFRCWQRQCLSFKKFWLHYTAPFIESLHLFIHQSYIYFFQISLSQLRSVYTL